MPHVIPNGKPVIGNTRTGPQNGECGIFGFGAFNDFDRPRFGRTTNDQFLDGIFGAGAFNWWRKLCLMRRDPTISMLRQMFIAPIIAAGWTVQAEDDVPDDIVDFATEEMERVRMELVRSAGLGCVDWGWAPYEKIFHIRPDGKIGIKKLKSLLQQMTIIEIDDDTGAFTGLSQDDVFLGPESSLLFHFNVEGTNWYGEAIMKGAEGPFDSSCRIDVSRDKLNGRIAASHWLIYYPIGTTDTGTEAVPNIRQNFDIAEGIMDVLLKTGSVTLPNEIKAGINVLNDSMTSEDAYAWRIELLSPGESSAGFYIDQLRYEDSLKARALGFPERAVTEGQYGTKAEAEAHGDFAIMGLELRSSELTQTVSRHLLRDLIEVNFGEEFRNAVTLTANPLLDKTKAKFWMLYNQYLSNPDVLIAEYDKTNMKEIAELLGIPMFEEGTENPDPLKDEIDEREESEAIEDDPTETEEEDDEDENEDS